MVWAGAAIAFIDVLLVIILAAAETVRIYWIDDATRLMAKAAPVQHRCQGRIMSEPLVCTHPLGLPCFDAHLSWYGAMTKPPRPWLHTWSSSYSDVCETAT